MFAVTVSGESTVKCLDGFSWNTKVFFSIFNPYLLLENW